MEHTIAHLPVRDLPVGHPPSQNNSSRLHRIPTRRDKPTLHGFPARESMLDSQHGTGRYKKTVVRRNRTRNPYKILPCIEVFLSSPPLLHIFFGYRNFLARRFSQHQHLPLLPPEQPGLHIAVIEHEHRRAKRPVHIATWIQHILKHAIETSTANPVKLRANQRTLAIDGMANGTLLLKD